MHDGSLLRKTTVYDDDNDDDEYTEVNTLPFHRQQENFWSSPIIVVRKRILTEGHPDTSDLTK